MSQTDRIEKMLLDAKSAHSAQMGLLKCIGLLIAGSLKSHPDVDQDSLAEVSKLIKEH